MTGYLQTCHSRHSPQPWSELLRGLGGAETFQPVPNRPDFTCQSGYKQPFRPLQTGRPTSRAASTRAEAPAATEASQARWSFSGASVCGADAENNHCPTSRGNPFSTGALLGLGLRLSPAWRGGSWARWAAHRDAVYRCDGIWTQAVYPDPRVQIKTQS